MNIVLRGSVHLSFLDTNAENVKLGKGTIVRFQPAYIAAKSSNKAYDYLIFVATNHNPFVHHDLAVFPTFLAVNII